MVTALPRVCHAAEQGPEEVGGELLVNVAVSRVELVEEVGGDMLFTCTIYIQYILEEFKKSQNALYIFLLKK
jgi:hypothetical protein